MKKLHLPEKNFLPEIILDKEKNIFEIKGKSIPENADLFYKPIIEWFDEYFKDPNPETVVKLNLVYLNSSSVRALGKLIKSLEEYYQKGFNVKIQWISDKDDEEMIYTAEDYINIFKIPIEIITK